MIFTLSGYNPKKGVIIMIIKDMETIKKEIKALFNNTSDLVLYEFTTLCGDLALIIYIDGLVDKFSLNDDLIKPLTLNLLHPKEVLSTVFLADSMEVKKIEDILRPLTNGYAILFMEGLEIAYGFEMIKWNIRAIEEPGGERVIRGPKEGFIEDIQINKSLIRRRIRNNNLVFEDYVLGTQTNTNISLVYIKGIVKEEILEELRNRIKKVSLDGVLDSEYIEYYIEDAPNSMICTMGHTEKPNVAAGRILEGRIGIICDGSPDVLTIPKLFIENIQMADDYYSRHQYSTFLRLIRLTALILSIFLPGFIVSLKTFHQEMIPTQLLMTMAVNVENVPFTPLIEALVMVFFLEMIKESGLRIPNNIGTAVTVVSGLVLGQTAVQAGLVGPTMVIAIALSGITEFIVPDQKEIIVIYRLIILILGGIIGLFGIACGSFLMVAHLISLKSFGVPYMYPIAPYDSQGMKDFIFMRPLKDMTYRPKPLTDNRRRRGGKNEK